MATNNTQQKQRLEEIKKQLIQIGSRETSFVRVELLFYETIQLARTSNSGNDNPLLLALKKLEDEQYKDTKELFRKSSRREQVIRKFIARFKTVLNTAIKHLETEQSFSNA